MNPNNTINKYKALRETNLDPNLTKNEKLIYNHLILCLNEKKLFAYPSYPELMEVLGVKRRNSVSETIEQLRQKGYIRTEKGFRGANNYYLLKHITDTNNTHTSNETDTSNKNDTSNETDTSTSNETVTPLVTKLLLNKLIYKLNNKLIYNGQNKFDLSISQNQFKCYKENAIGSNNQDNNTSLKAYKDNRDNQQNSYNQNNMEVVTDKKEKRKTSAKKKRESKHRYGEYNHVLLKDTERDNLIEELGEDKFNLVIKKLDEYIEIKGVKYKNHYLVIKKWVIEAVEKDLKKNQTQELKENYSNLDTDKLINEFLGGNINGII